VTKISLCVFCGGSIFDYIVSITFFTIHYRLTTNVKCFTSVVLHLLVKKSREFFELYFLCDNIIMKLLYFSFLRMDRIDVINYIKEKYDIDPEYLWEKYPTYAIFRNVETRKRFGLV